MSPDKGNHNGICHDHRFNCYFSEVYWKSFRIMTLSNGNIFRVTGHLCGEFTGPLWIPLTRPVTRSFDVLFDVRLKKRLNKQSWGWWFETPSRSLWRHCNEGNHNGLRHDHRFDCYCSEVYWKSFRIKIDKHTIFVDFFRNLERKTQILFYNVGAMFLEAGAEAWSVRGAGLVDLKPR